MLKKLKSYDEIVLALVNENLIMRALDFAEEYKVSGLKISIFLQNIERLRSDGY